MQSITGHIARKTEKDRRAKKVEILTVGKNGVARCVEECIIVQWIKALHPVKHFNF